MMTLINELIALGRIDSMLKLRILLLLAEHPHLCREPQALSARLHEPPWELQETLESLVHAGLLEQVETQSGICYCLPAHPSIQQLLRALCIWFDDPYQRETIYKLVRAASEERQIRNYSDWPVRQACVGVPWCPLSAS